uniref:Uncharacterized protein n=1 Tax=Mustela putorius furo TaxID=9669 RepID=M3Z618_MUSPF
MGTPQDWSRAWEGALETNTHTGPGRQLSPCRAPHLLGAGGSVKDTCGLPMEPQGNGLHSRTPSSKSGPGSPGPIPASGPWGPRAAHSPGNAQQEEVELVGVGQLGAVLRERVQVFHLQGESAHVGPWPPSPPRKPPHRPAPAHACPPGPTHVQHSCVCPCVRASPPLSLWGAPGQGRLGSAPLTSCFSGRSLRNCLRTSTSNLVVSPARIMAVTSSLELRERGRGLGEQRARRPLLWAPGGPQRMTSLRLRPELPGHREGNPPAWGRTVTWLEADSRAPCLSGHPCSFFLGAAQDPGRGLTHAQGPRWQEPALSSCREGPGGRGHRPLLSGPPLPQGAGWGSPGPPVGAVWGTDWPQGGRVALPRSDPPPKALHSPRGQGLGRTSCSPFKLLQKDVEVQALLGVQKGDLENTPPWCWYLWLHRDPCTPTTGPGQPYLLGLLPGGGGHALLGLGLREAEEPLDAGEVGLHDLGA